MIKLTALALILRRMDVSFTVVMRHNSTWAFVAGDSVDAKDFEMKIENEGIDMEYSTYGDMGSGYYIQLESLT